MPSLWDWVWAHFLWLAGPVAAAIVFLLTGRRDRRREAEIERWAASPGPRDAKKADEPRNARRVNGVPSALMRMVDVAGGGKPVAYFELVPKLAYLVMMGADAMNGSDQTSVVARLDEPAPTLTSRPLPIIEGERIPNTGVLFKKDPDMTELLLVERTIEGKPEPPASESVDKPIRKWLSPPLRAALKDFPDAWLRVDGKVMALTLYGPADAERLNELITVADIIFAEYGADGGPSLFGDDEEEDPEQEEAAPAAPPAKKQDAPRKDAKGAGAKA